MYKKIIEKYNDIKNIGNSLSLLNWDQSTGITKNGVIARSETMATLSKLAHELITSEDLFEMLEEITASGFPELSDIQKSEMVIIKEEAEKERKIPSELVEELTRVTSLAMSSWEIARRKNDDGDFLPLLKTIFNLKKRYADHLGYEDNPYDALLDIYDKGLRYSFIKPLFENLEKETVKLLDMIGTPTEINFDDNKFDTGKQRQFGDMILKNMGIDFDSFRQDISAHPFTTEIGLGDVRITTNINDDSFIKGFYSTVHEGGHALYTLGTRNHFKNSACGELTSLALHESQSRFYENIVARSKVFWDNYFPGLKKFFPKQFEGMTADDIFRAVNSVKKSQIRIDADEVTYNLHIILRTEIENLIINDLDDAGKINDIWNEKFKGMFGFYPESKSKGYLQDIHWSDGLFGYFPTYTLGNIISAQFFYKLRDDTGAFKSLSADEFKKIYDWFDKNLYSKGRIYDSFETVKLICNENLKSEYFIKYVNEKFSDLKR